MMHGSATSSLKESQVPDRWTARKIRPVVILYVLGVFAAFIVMSIVVFQSREAVKALVVAAVGTVIAIAPGVAERIEYRLTASGVEKRTVNAKKPREFTGVFLWSELSRVVAMRHGFKYFKTLDESNPLRRFWKAYLSDQYSGEVLAEREDLERVLDFVSRQGIPVS
jgi:Na+/serine symporter